MEQMQAQAENVGTTVKFDIVTSIDLSRRPFTAVGDSGDSYIADTVVIATGAQARWLGLESEQKYQGGGVSACATCDGFFYRGKEIAVVGGGNTAVEEALFLTNFGSRVYLIHRRDELRAEKIMQDRLFKNPKIEVIWDSVVEEITGEESPPVVTGLRLKNVKTGEISQLPVEGVFIAIGHTPASEIFKGQVEMDKGGYVITKPDSTTTNVPGGGNGLHGRAGGRKIPRRAGTRARRSRRGIAKIRSFSPKSCAKNHRLGHCAQITFASCRTVRPLQHVRSHYLAAN
jgi:thioredoxin reductase (NADPH)